MKRFYKKTALLFALCICLAMPCVSFAAEADVNAVQTETEASVPNAYTGWKKSGSRWFYYFSGSKAKGVWEIGGKWYLFNSYGTWVGTPGWHTLKPYGEPYRYYMKSDGSLTTGWKKIGGEWYAFMSNETLPVGITGMGEYTYGSMLKGHTYALHNLNKAGDKGAVYSFHGNGKMVKGWFTEPYNGKRYYHDSNGKAVSGWKKIGGKQYHFSSYKVTKNEYGFTIWSGCAMTKGWKTIGGKKYYFSKSTGVMFTGTHKIGGVVYKFGSDGALRR